MRRRRPARETALTVVTPRSASLNQISSPVGDQAKRPEAPEGRGFFEPFGSRSKTAPSL